MMQICLIQPFKITLQLFVEAHYFLIMFIFDYKIAKLLIIKRSLVVDSDLFRNFLKFLNREFFSNNNNQLIVFYMIKFLQVQLFRTIRQFSMDKILLLTQVERKYFYLKNTINIRHKLKKLFLQMDYNNKEIHHK